MQPRASIVITNYDYARFVGDAIASAVNQVGGGVEVIVVDDGSNDGSLDAIKAADPAGSVVVIAQPNGGQASAFNAGFARASGRIVFFLDADDVLADDVVDRVEVAMQRPRIGRVQFRLDLIDANGDPLEGEMPAVDVELSAGDLRGRLVSAPDDIVWQPTSGNAFATDVLAAILPMPTEPYRICADYYLSNLSCVHGDVAVLDGVGGSYRIHGENADHADVLTLERIRANIVRTSITHGHLIEECRRSGLHGVPDDADDVHSVSSLAMRMISRCSARDGHPIDADTRFGLAGAGVRAGFARFDVGLPRRCGIAAWFVAMAISPRSLLRSVSRPFADVSLDAELGAVDVAET